MNVTAEEMRRLSNGNRDNAREITLILNWLHTVERSAKRGQTHCTVRYPFLKTDDYYDHYYIEDYLKALGYNIMTIPDTDRRIDIYWDGGQRPKETNYSVPHSVGIVNSKVFQPPQPLSKK